MTAPGSFCKHQSYEKDSYILSSISEATFHDYIDPKDHKMGGCACEKNNVGKEFFKATKAKDVFGEFSGLHLAATTPNHNKHEITFSYKKQLIDCYLEDDPELLFKRNSNNQTPLMIAARCNYGLTKYLLQAYLQSEDYKEKARCNDSVLTSSFLLKRSERSDKDSNESSDDISLLILEDLYSQKKLSPDILIKAKNGNCTDKTLLKMLPFLDSETKLKTCVAFDIISVLLKIKDIVSFEAALKCVISGLDHELSSKAELFSMDFNILKWISSLHMFSKDSLEKFLTSADYLNYKVSCICPKTEENIAHYACRSNNLDLLEGLLNIDEPEFIRMLCQYNASKKRPLSVYRTSPLGFVNKFARLGLIDKDFWYNLCIVNGYNIGYKIFRHLRDAKEFTEFVGLDTDFLQHVFQNCNREGDNILHVMLREPQTVSALQKVLKKFQTCNISINAVNDKGLTPLHVLCAHIAEYVLCPQYDEDDAMETVKLLLEYGADRNLLGSNQTTEWFARMSLEMVSHHSDLENILPLITQEPRMNDYRNTEFSSDKPLFEKLRSFEEVETCTTTAALISLLGPYPRTIANHTQIVCYFTSPATWLSCLRDTGKHTVAIHPDVEVTVEGSLKRKEGSIQDLISGKDHQNKSEFTTKQKDLLLFLKSKSGLSYLSLPEDWALSTVEEDTPFLELSQITLETDPQLLKNRVEKLAALGLIFTVRYKEEDYILNIPYILDLASWVGLPPDQLSLTRCLMYTAGVPLPTSQITTDQLPAQVADKSVRIGLVPGCTTSSYLLVPLTYLLSYILVGEMVTISHGSENNTNVVKVKVGKSEIMIAGGDGCIDVELSNETSVTLDILTFSLKLVLKHLNFGCLGKRESRRIMELESDPRTENEEGDDVTPLLTGKKKVTEMLESRVNDIPSDNLRRLLRSSPVPSLDKEFSAPLKTDVDLINEMRNWRFLTKEHERGTVISFYKKLKQDPECAEFTEAFIKSLGLEDSHMQTCSDQIAKQTWWIITTLIATLLFLAAALVIHFLVDIDIGYVALSFPIVFAIVFALSALLKKCCVRNETGGYDNITDADFLAVFQKCSP